ncbi:MAG: phage major capsid protein [Proteobacteria bacterium]|nr:phage major capsid protein [Pseudomonadota bacterium]
MSIRKRPETLAPQQRFVSLRVESPGDGARALVDADTRTIRLTFSSEEPVDMWYGTEILSHAKGAMRMGQRQQTMPLLYNHNRDRLLGIVETIELDTAARKGVAVVRFAPGEDGDWAMQQVNAGCLVNVSFMYRVWVWVEDVEEESYTAIDWEPYEVSLVTVPADASVGVGRSADDTENPVEIQTRGSPPGAQQDKTDQPAPAGFFTPGARQSQTPEPPKGADMKRNRHPLQNQAGDETTQSAGGGAPVVDAAREQARGAEAERKRMSEIEALCDKYKVTPELKREMIQKGASVEQAKLTVVDMVLERAKREGKPAADFGDTTNPDLTEREKARYSMLRAVNAAISGDWSKAGFELECSNAIGQRLGRGAAERAFFMPTNLQFYAQSERAAYATGAAGTGGALVATNLLAGSFIEVLRNKARVLQLGATVLSGLVGNVDIPRQTGATQTFWTAEGVNTSEGEATFDKVSLTLKTIGTYSQITRNMLLQSTPDIDMIARADLIAQIALGIDLAALSGTGSGGQPLGIANVSGIGSVVGGVNGAQLTIDNMIDLETAVTYANAPEDSLAYLTNAKAIGWLKKQKSTTGQYLWTNAPNGGRSATPGEINGYSVARSNQARSTLTKGTANGVCSEVFFGAWSELLIGEWGVLEIVPNPYDAAVYKNGGVLLRALQSLDIGVRHAASFSTMSDALTA